MDEKDSKENSVDLDVDLDLDSDVEQSEPVSPEPQMECDPLAATQVVNEDEDQTVSSIKYSKPSSQLLELLKTDSQLTLSKDHVLTMSSPKLNNLVTSSTSSVHPTGIISNPLETTLVQSLSPMGSAIKESLISIPPGDLKHVSSSNVGLASSSSITMCPLLRSGSTGVTPESISKMHKLAKPQLVPMEHTSIKDSSQPPIPLPPTSSKPVSKTSTGITISSMALLSHYINDQLSRSSIIAVSANNSK